MDRLERAQLEEAAGRWAGWRARWAEHRWRRLERLHSLRVLLAHRLPPPIYGRSTAPEDMILVFAQHAPGPGYLGPKLCHLAANHYDTITTREYADWLAGHWVPSQPTVMLTFDDGLRAFAERTFPLLFQHQFRSVLFVCPGLVDLASAGGGGASRLARQTILTWDELRTLAATSLVDIQSHGLWHNRARCGRSPVAVGIERIDAIMQYGELLPPDGRLERVLAGRGQDVPLYPGVPFFAAENDGETGIPEAAFDEDLAEARRRIETNLPGHQVRGLAFPWWNGSPRAVQAARRTGHELVFWGLAGVGPHLGRRATDPLRIGRLGFDWILCLPGGRRTSVTRLIIEKLRGLHVDSR